MLVRLDGLCAGVVDRALAKLVEGEVQQVVDVLRVLLVTPREGLDGVQHGAVLLDDRLRDLQTLRVVLIRLQRHHQLQYLGVTSSQHPDRDGELIALDVHVVHALQLVVPRQIDDVVAQRLFRQEGHVRLGRGGDGRVADDVRDGEHVDDGQEKGALREQLQRQHGVGHHVVYHVETVAGDGPTLLAKDGYEDVVAVLKCDELANLLITASERTEEEEHFVAHLLAVVAEHVHQLLESHGTAKNGLLHDTLIHSDAVLQDLDCADSSPHVRGIKQAENDFDVGVFLAIMHTRYRVHTAA